MKNRHIDGPEEIFFGKNKETKEKIFMTKPSWNCGRYWSFGYLGNENCHYHLNGYQTRQIVMTDENGKLRVFTEKRNINMYDALLKDYELNKTVKSDLWQFCEQASTIYTLKKCYEVFYRGGSSYTSHELQDKIKSEEITRHLADELLPTLLQDFWTRFSS